MPIALSLNVVSSGPRPLRFFNLWVDNPELRKVFNEEEWDISGHSARRLWGRLKRVREVVRRWQGEQFLLNGNPIRECEATIKDRCHPIR